MHWKWPFSIVLSAFRVHFNCFRYDKTASVFCLFVNKLYFNSCVATSLASAACCLVCLAVLLVFCGCAIVFLVCLRVYKEKKKNSIFQMKTLLEVVLLLYCSGKLCYAVVIQFIIRVNDYDAELSGWWVV